MTPNEKKYFEFHGSRRYFVTLAILLVTGILCLSIAIPYIMSANEYGWSNENYTEFEAQHADKIFRWCKNLESDTIRTVINVHIEVFFIAGVIALVLAISQPIIDTIICRKIRRRMREARKARHNR